MEFGNLKVKDIDFVIKYTSPNKNWSVSNRTSHIIGIAYSGDEIHDFGGNSFTIKENCIFFLNQRDNYSVTVNEKCTSHSIHFTTYEPIDDDSFCIKLNSIYEISGLFERCERYNKGVNNREHLLAACFYQICAEFNNALQKQYHPVDKRMQIAREYAAVNFCNSDCLSKMYASCTLSRRQFDALFKKIFGVTPNRYITNLKVGYAKKLLINSGLPVSEVSQKCGFRDVYYFSAFFKKETGFSPSHFRKG